MKPSSFVVSILNLILLVGCSSHSSISSSVKTSSGKTSLSAATKNTSATIKSKPTKKKKSLKDLKAMGIGVTFFPSVSIQDEQLTSEGGIKQNVLAGLLDHKDTITSITFLRTKLLSDVGLAQVGAFAKLQTFDIDGRPQQATPPIDWLRVTNKGLEHLHGLKDTTHLSICGVELTDKSLQCFSNLNLSTLILRGWGAHPIKVTSKGLSLLMINGLQELTIDDADFGLSDLSFLSNCPKVHELDLIDCNLRDNHMKGLDKCKELKSLNLTVNPELTSESLKLIGALPMLQRLDLYGCKKITDNGLDYLKQLANLRDLNVPYTQVTKKRASKFKETNPNCSIKGEGWEIE